MNFGMGMPMTRSTDVKGLKELKAPEEGGTKKEHDDFEETLSDHVRMACVTEEDGAQVGGSEGIDGCPEER